MADSNGGSDGRSFALEVLHYDSGAPRKRRSDHSSRGSSPPPPARVSRALGEPQQLRARTPPGRLGVTVSQLAYRTLHYVRCAVSYSRQADAVAARRRQFAPRGVRGHLHTIGASVFKFLQGALEIVGRMPATLSGANSSWRRRRHPVTNSLRHSARRAQCRKLFATRGLQAVQEEFAPEAAAAH